MTKPRQRRRNRHESKPPVDESPVDTAIASWRAERNGHLGPEHGEWVDKLLGSRALREALSDAASSNDASDRLGTIYLFCLMSRRAFANGLQDPRALANEMASVEHEKRTALLHLESALALLGPQYATTLAHVIDAVRDDPRPCLRRARPLGLLFRSADLGRRGRAARDVQSAWIGWMVRTLDRLVPESARNRNAAIAEIVTICGVATTGNHVRSILESARR